MIDRDDERVRVFGTARAARAVAAGISAARADGARATAIELTAPDVDLGRIATSWIVELELDGAPIGRLCRDGLVRRETAR